MRKHPEPLPSLVSPSRSFEADRSTMTAACLPRCTTSSVWLCARAGPTGWRAASVIARYSGIQSIHGKAASEKQDIVILNAAAALVVGKVAQDFKDGVEVARDAIKSGKAQDKLAQLIKYCGDLEKLKESEKKFL